jgi:hypothetical protein
MQCSEFDNLLEQEPDLPLSNTAAAHLDTCSNCRIIWHDLAAIRTAGLDWGADEPTPPPSMWIALRAQLESEGLIREQRSPNEHSNSWFSEMFGGPWLGWASRPALAGASLSVLLVAASLVSVQGFTPTALLVHHNQPFASSGLSTAPADLDRTLDGDMKLAMASIPTQDASVTTSLQQNLGIVDNLIAVCEKSVREQPDNQMARDYLYGAYQQKAVLLATAMDHSTLEGR